MPLNESELWAKQAADNAARSELYRVALMNILEIGKMYETLWPLPEERLRIYTRSAIETCMEIARTAVNDGA